MQPLCYINRLCLYLEPFTGTVACHFLACKAIIAVNPSVAQRDLISSHRFIRSGFNHDTTIKLSSFTSTRTVDLYGIYREPSDTHVFNSALSELCTDVLHNTNTTLEFLLTFAGSLFALIVSGRCRNCAHVWPVVLPKTVIVYSLLCAIKFSKLLLTLCGSTNRCFGKNRKLVWFSVHYNEVVEMVTHKFGVVAR